jgi:ribosomal protein S13
MLDNYNDYISTNFFWKTLETSLLNGFSSETYNDFMDQHHFYSFVSDFYYKFDLNVDECVIFIIQNINVLIEYDLVSDVYKRWIHNINFFFSCNKLTNNISILNVNLLRDSSAHTLFSSDTFKFVDDFKFYGLDDYTLRVETFSDYNLFQFFCLRSGFKGYLANLASKYLGVSQQLNVKLINNYWHYGISSIFLESRSSSLDDNIFNYILSRHLRLISLNSRKGIRLLNGYPIYGQRTRSNAKTSSKYPYKLQFKNLD